MINSAVVMNLEVMSVCFVPLSMANCMARLGGMVVAVFHHFFAAGP